MKHQVAQDSNVSSRYIIIGCSIKWSKGIHQISLKSNSKSHGYDAIGMSIIIEKLCEEMLTEWYTHRVNSANSVIYLKNGELIAIKGIL